MYLIKKIKIFFVILFLINIYNKNLIALENRILFKVDNEIITSIDIYEEIKFLKTFNPEINLINEAELFEISKNSILRDKIKKIEIMNFVKELRVEEKFLIKLIKGKYSKIGLNSIEDFENYLKNKDLNIKNIKEKFAIELIWNDLIYRKFSQKISIDKEKIKEQILNNPKKEIERELLLSEIVFNVSEKSEYKDKYKKILNDIEKIGFKKTALIHSNSDTASTGGLIGWVKEDNLNEGIKKIIVGLEPGQLSKPVRTSSGFIILRVEDKKEYELKFDVENKVNEIIRSKTNYQLNQFSNIYLNKLKKDLIIYGL